MSDCKGASRYTKTQPRDIDLTAGISGFGKCEVEVAAERLIRFFNETHNGRWTTFTFQELHQFYVSKGWQPESMLFGLIGYWYDDGGIGGIQFGHPSIIHWNNALSVTEEFVERVVKSIADRRRKSILGHKSTTYSKINK